MPQTDETMTENMIKAKIAQLKTEHPVLAGILDKVQSMNATQTLIGILGKVQWVYMYWKKLKTKYTHDIDAN